jgi:hypothetical protein
MVKINVAGTYMPIYRQLNLMCARSFSFASLECQGEVRSMPLKPCQLNQVGEMQTAGKKSSRDCNMLELFEYWGRATPAGIFDGKARRVIWTCSSHCPPFRGRDNLGEESERWSLGHGSVSSGSCLSSVATQDESEGLQ